MARRPYEPPDESSEHEAAESPALERKEQRTGRELMPASKRRAIGHGGGVTNMGHRDWMHHQGSKKTREML